MSTPSGEKTLATRRPCRSRSTTSQRTLTPATRASRAANDIVPHANCWPATRTSGPARGRRSVSLARPATTSPPSMTLTWRQARRRGDRGTTRSRPSSTRDRRARALCVGRNPRDMTTRAPPARRPLPRTRAPRRGGVRSAMTGLRAASTSHQGARGRDRTHEATSPYRAGSAERPNKRSSNVCKPDDATLGQRQLRRRSSRRPFRDGSSARRAIRRCRPAAARR